MLQWPRTIDWDWEKIEKHEMKCHVSIEREREIDQRVTV